MVKLMLNTTKNAINNIVTEQKQRPYLGMSGLGHSCERYLWYSFRWCYKDEIDARIARLFQRGHNEEAVIIDLLNKVGVKVYDEQEEVVAVHGHVKGHIDGKALGVIEAPKTAHLLELKTMNDKAFKGMKLGVKAAKPVYYTQMQLYMKFTKLTRALFIAANKNDDDLYIERVVYDAHHADTMLERAESIVLSAHPPEKKFKPTWYECKWCSAYRICQALGDIERNCRTCKNVDLLPAGKWSCSLTDELLTTDEQRLGCEKYVRI